LICGTIRWNTSLGIAVCQSVCDSISKKLDIKTAACVRRRFFTFTQYFTKSFSKVIDIISTILSIGKK